MIDWLLLRRTISRSATFLLAAVLIGPLAPSLLVALILGFSLPNSLPGHLANTVMAVAGGYVLGLAPAFISAMVILLRSPASIAEAMVITFATSAVAILLVTAVTSGNGNVWLALQASLMFGALSLVGAIAAGLWAAWCGAFAPKASD